ncbi:hypothetical protein [Pelagicoccus sp. SDUM812003]|uniref:hypothetical protein n=1 Tax=Pelagicoccus sp. SDUM812003 TaxID=3041267 RepID=UPI00280DB0B6|nr:hypothetical protein [Pelagicoccus sp. SDUM812003]MDQ8204592.1 hypothetical protein [Pelagicoccus sp. SDUM812003]
MAWRIDKYVVRGLIQNIVPGRVVGTIWLKGLNQPIELNLRGNCYRDIAGARLEFKNPSPIEGDYTGFDLFQDGTVGDITASKKVKVLVDPEDEESESTDDGPAFTWANCLYLEWFSEANGRVLVESVDFSWKIGLPKWSLSADDERQQVEANKQAMFKFMEEVSRVLDPKVESEISDPEGEMNEFQWEAYLQKTDARSDMLLELFEKYEDDPDCENLIAQAMGWDIESMEVTEEMFDDWDDDDPENEPDEAIPNHPVISRMVELTSQLYYEAENRGLITEDTVNPWNQLIWHAQMTVSKLIAALEPVSEGVPAEDGFIIATLKRALHLLHLTIATLEACTTVSADQFKWTSEARKELFELRETIIDLMQSYRS